VIAQGQAFIVPRGCWHRLSVLEPGRLVFLTPTAGSERRPHDASRSHPAPQITKGDPS
jgi:mannose-6-phosphate isomerase-like protein (cupin superfamily)